VLKRHIAAESDYALLDYDTLSWLSWLGQAGILFLLTWVLFFGVIPWHEAKGFAIPSTIIRGASSESGNSGIIGYARKENSLCWFRIDACLSRIQKIWNIDGTCTLTKHRVSRIKNSFNGIVFEVNFMINPMNACELPNHKKLALNATRTGVTFVDDYETNFCSFSCPKQVNLANNQFGAMRGIKFVASEIKNFFGYSTMLSGGAPESEGEACNGNRGDCGQRTAVFVNERALAYSNPRDAVIQIGLFVLCVIAFITGCAFLVRR
jgi:hypothetical protein